MNILYTITSYPPSLGGAQLYAHEIIKRIAKEHNVKVMSFFDTNRNDWLLGTTLRTPGQKHFYKYEGVDVERISFDKKEKSRMSQYVYTYYFNKMHNINALAKFIEGKLNFGNKGIDLIHNIRVGREPLSYASYNFARKLNVPFVFTPLHHPRWSHWFFKEYQQLYRKADALFSLTPYEKEIYESFGVEENKVFVTGTGAVLVDKANPDEFKRKYDLSDNIILFIGQGYKYKGMDILLKAAKIVFKTIEDANFVFIGPHTKYSKKLFKKQSDRRIKHLGKVDLQIKTDSLAACKIFCLPSKQESFGAVFLEAWMFEKPVIAADTGQLRCVIKDGGNGYLVKPSPELIADKIIKLLKNDDLRNELGTSGRKTVESEFNWDILCQKTINAYESLIGNLDARQYERVLGQ